MQLTHLQLFLAVVNEGSFAGAAKALWISPSRVTERIQQLERELQVSLLDRAGRQVTPTQAGRALIPRAEAIVREMNLIAALFPAESSEVVRVGMRSLPASFRDRVHHTLELAVGRENLTVLPLDPQTQTKMLLAGQLECGFVWGWAAEPLRSFPVLVERLAVVVPATQHFAELERVTPRDLAGLRLVVPVPTDAMPAVGLRPYLDYLPHSDPVNIAVSDATYLMVSGGRHCAFVPQERTDHFGLSTETRRNILIKPLADPVPTLTTSFVWRSELDEDAKFTSLIDYMRQQFGEPTLG
jgi:DNA-binding transcriptional LysR family regulator